MQREGAMAELDDAILPRPDLLEFNGRPVNPASIHLGTLQESADLIGRPEQLHHRFEADGYLYLPGLLDPDSVLAARHELLLKYATLGEIDDRRPLLQAVAGDRSGLAGANMRAFTESLRTGARYESVILDPRLIEVVAAVLDGPIRPYDFRWPRLARPGEGCGLHCDGPYMSRGTDRHLSTWIPLG